MSTKSLIPLEGIERRIYIMRGHRVMLDRDLAYIYGVSTKRLNERVKRNRQRFPEDFMFQLTVQEWENFKGKIEASSLRSHFATLKTGQGQHRKYLPYVFTEHGAVMLASILSSRIAVNASIQVVRAFVRLREMVSAHKELAAKLAELERKVAHHDEHIQSLFDAIRELMEPLKKTRPQIGFRPHKK